MPAPYNPTGATLPALVFNSKTRTAAEFLLYYNPAPAYYFGSIGIDGSGNPQLRVDPQCGSSGVIPASGFGIVRAKVAIQSPTDQIVTVGGGSATIPALSGPGQAAELGVSIASVSQGGISVTGALPGDSYDIIMLPNPANDVLICYDNGFTADIGTDSRAIPRKFNPVDHYVRQRPDNKITLKEMFCCNLEGLASLRQRDCTFIGKYYPNGGAIPSEIVVFTVARLTSIPRENPEDANESVMVNAEGVFRDACFFSARPM